MKKRMYTAIAALVLAFAVLSTGAMAEFGSFSIIGTILSQQNNDSDIANATAWIVPWPELPVDGMPITYGDGMYLVIPDGGVPQLPYLYDANTGACTELTADPAQAEMYLAAPMNRGAVLSFRVSNGLVFVDSVFYRFIVDTGAATLRMSVDFDNMLSDGSTVLRDDMLGVDYTITHRDGSQTGVQFTGDPGYDYAVNAMCFGEGVVGIIAKDTYLDRSKPAHYALGIGDCYKGGKMEFIDVCGFEVLGGPDKLLLCGADRALMYNVNQLAMLPVIMVRYDTGEALALDWDGTAITAKNVAEYTDGSGFIRDDNRDGFLYPVGTAGRYAAFVLSKPCSLVIFDMFTLESRIVLTEDELKAAGFNTDNNKNMMTVTNCWYGEDMIGSRNGYDIKLSFE